MKLKLDYLILLGLLGQGMFFLRFLIQRYYSEMEKKVVIPIVFWYLSIFGAVLILIYSILRHDIPFMLGSFFSIFLYVRNLFIYKREAAEESTSESSNSKKFKTKNPLKRYFLNNFQKKLLKEVKNIKFNSLLDAGCGEAYILHTLKGKIEGKRVVGIDISEDALQSAKNKFPDFEFIRSDLHNISFEDREFDLSMCLEVLEHMENPENVVKELLRISKVVMISIPDEPVFTIMRFLSGNDVMKLGVHPEHINFWNRKSFLALLEKNFDGEIKIIPSLPWNIFILYRK